MRLRVALAAVLVAALGGASAVAVADTSTATVAVCATASTPSHTVAVDGSGVATIAGDTAENCATTTFTIPTATQTVTSPASTTIPTTTTSTTSTTTPTTTSASPPSFASETSYTQSPPPFNQTSEVDVSSAAALKSALAALKPGELVKATAPFTVSSSSSVPLVIANRLSGPAEINLAGINVVYTGTSDVDAVSINNAQNVRIFGGDISTSDTGGPCIEWNGSQDSLWWGFVAHDCGADGMWIFTRKPGATGFGPVERNDIEGEIYKMDQHPAWDPHPEKCSGIHGANLDDGNYAPFDHNRIALYVHDSACEGGGIEFGSAFSTNVPDANKIILQCSNLTFMSTIQTGGNCYQVWGYGATNTDFLFLQATNITGHPYWAGGMSSAGSLAGTSVVYGRASNVRLNPRYASDPNWDKRGDSVFLDVSPLP